VVIRRRGPRESMLPHDGKGYAIREGPDLITTLSIEFNSFREGFMRSRDYDGGRRKVDSIQECGKAVPSARRAGKHVGDFQEHEFRRQRAWRANSTAAKW